MISRHLLRPAFTRFAVGSPRLAALPVHGVPAVVDSIPSRRSIINEADLSPLEELSGPRQKLRQVLLDYRNNK